MALKLRQAAGWSDRLQPGTRLYWGGSWQKMKYLFEAIDEEYPGNPWDYDQGPPPHDWDFDMQRVYRVHAFEPPTVKPPAPIVQEETAGGRYDPIDVKVKITSHPMGNWIPRSWHRQIYYTITWGDNGAVDVWNERTYNPLLADVKEYIVPATVFQDRHAQLPGDRVWGEMTVKMRYANEVGAGPYSDDSPSVRFDTGEENPEG